MAMRLYLLISLLLFVGAKADDLSRCPAHIAREARVKTFRDSCYQFITYESHWEDARRDCRTRGGDLVVIPDQATQNFVMRSLRGFRWRTKGVWIGAHDRKSEMRWEWVNGQRVNWGNWGPGQPSCHFLRCLEDCAQIRRDLGGQWHDYSCRGWSQYSFICQYAMLPTTTTTSTTTTTTTTTTPTPSTSTTTKPTTSTTPTTMAAVTRAALNTTIIDIVYHSLDHNKGVNSANRVRNSSKTPSYLSTSTWKHDKVKVHGQEGQSQEIHQVESAKSASLATGTMIGLALAILLGILIGICLGAFIFIKRRKKEQLDDLPRVVFENPYYGEVTRPLTEGHEDSDDGGEKATVVKYVDEDIPKNDYDIPPSMCLSNPTYGANVMLTGTEGAYDVVRTRKFPDYDCPPRPTPLCSIKGEPSVENLYESLENLQNLKAALAEKDKEMESKCCDSEKPKVEEEEERYVAMGTIPRPSANDA